MAEITLTKSNFENEVLKADKPVLVEGNTLPCYDMVQNYGHLEEKTGIKPRFEEIVGKDFFK